MKQFGTELWDDARGVATDAVGNVYIAGATIGSWVAKVDATGRVLWTRQLGTDGYGADGVTTDAAGNVYITGSEAWLAKLDTAGRVLWKQQLGGAEEDDAFGIATDTAGNVYTVGSTGEWLADVDAWVTKVDTAGRVLWKRQLGTEELDWAEGVATDAAGNVYIAGETFGSLGGVNRGGSDAWLAKLDPTGRVLWKRQLGTADSDDGRGVATDAAGNVYITGHINGSDAWLAKLDPTGRVLWKRQLGTAGSDYARGVATDAAGNIYLTGDTSGSLGSVNRGYTDAWLAKVDTVGRVLWKRQLGTKVHDYAYGVASDAAGNVYITGGTSGSLGSLSRGESDAWLAKYSTRR